MTVPGAWSPRDRDAPRKTVLLFALVSSIERCARDRSRPETTSLHLDILSDRKRIHSHICAVAYPVREAAGELRSLEAVRFATAADGASDMLPTPALVLIVASTLRCQFDCARSVGGMGLMRRSCGGSPDPAGFSGQPSA